MRRFGKKLYERRSSVIYGNIREGFGAVVRSKLLARRYHESINFVDRVLSYSQLYGLEAHESKDDKVGKIILCYSTVPLCTELEFTKQQRIEMELLFIVLSYIHMKGDTVAEQTLFGFLKRLGFQDEPHERFGHFKKKITETFVRQMYLKREKVQTEGDTDDK